MATEIEQLSALISSLVPNIVGNAVPSAHPDAMTIAAAAYQLYTLTMPPQEVIFGLSCAHSKTAALRVAIQFNVAEHLREAGPEGLSATELGKRCKVDGEKLARCLRTLSNVHVFKELRPDVFANNAISRELDTGRAISDIDAEPFGKHDGTNGFPALAELHASISGRSSGYLYENLSDPRTAFSDVPTHTPFTRAFLPESSFLHTPLDGSAATDAPGQKPDLNMFQWLNQPEQEYSRRMFGVSMSGTKVMERDGLFDDFDFDALPKDSVVVDVGGGFGAVMRNLLAKHPHLRVVVQDMPNIVAEGEKLWAKHSPEALKSGRAVLQPHDFFTPQPVRSASVFLMQHIIHNWSPARNKILLSNLAEAAMPTTRLLLGTNIITYTCKDTSALADEMNAVGAGFKEAPAPLLPNYGAANETGFGVDLCMMNLCNTQEYTIYQLKDLLAAGGWKIEKVYRNDRPNNFLDMVQCVLL